MASDRWSRHRFCRAEPDPVTGDLALTERVPYRYRELPDNETYVVGDGDTLGGIAGRKYLGLGRAGGLWWVIADFQPAPIIDPTLRLQPGTVLVLPSRRTVEESILSDLRRRMETDE